MWIISFCLYFIFALNLSWAETKNWTLANELSYSYQVIKAPQKSILWTQSKSLTDLNEIPPLKTADGSPFVYEILSQFMTQEKDWVETHAQIKFLSSNFSWQDSTVSKWISYSTVPKILLANGSLIKYDSTQYSSLIRILNSVKDTVNQGLIEKAPGKFQVLGLVTGESMSMEKKIRMWYGTAVFYHKDTIKYLPQMVGGDSIKLRNQLQNSIQMEMFDSVEVQMIGAHYVRAKENILPPVLVDSIVPILKKSAPVKINQGPFELEGRVIRITQKVDSKQLLNVFNSSGEVVQFWRFDGNKGSKEITLDKEHFPAGVYFIKLYNVQGSFQTQTILEEETE